MIQKLRRRLRRKGFTMVEVISAIVLVVALSAVAIFVIRPSALAKETRDAQRLSDMSNLGGLMEVAVGQGIVDLDENTIFVSLVAENSNCSDLNLPELSDPYVYQCVTVEGNLTKTNGNGWIPIDFSQVPGISLPILPVDPINTASRGLYYTYQVGYKFTALLESQKYASRATTDGGIDATVFEAGTTVTEGPSLARGNEGTNGGCAVVCNGLVGYWKFDEGSGPTVADASGNGYTLNLSNTVTWASGHIGEAVSLNGTDSYLSTASPTSAFDLATGSFTVTAWVYPSEDINGNEDIVSFLNADTYSGWTFGLSKISSWLRQSFQVRGAFGIGGESNNISGNTWHLLAATWNGSTEFTTYIDGSVDEGGTPLYEPQHPSSAGSQTLFIGNIDSYLGHIFYKGSLDEIRIYNRVLSQAEIQQLHNQ